MNQPLSKAMKDLLRWLVKNFPDGSLEILWIGVGEPFIKNFDRATPRIFTRARISQLVAREFLSIYSSDGRSGNMLLKTFIGARTRKLEIDILPKTFELVESNFEEMAVTGTLNMSIPKLTKNQRELATYLVHKSLGLNPEDPPENFSFTLTAGTIDARYPPGIQFKAFPRDFVDFEPLDIEPLVKADLIVRHSKIKHMYTMTQALYDLVKNNFLPATDSKSYSGKEPDESLLVLRGLLRTYFNEDEIQDLCFGWVDYEALSGDNKNARIRSLIEYARRTGNLRYLVGRAAKMRPNLDFPNFR